MEQKTENYNTREGMKNRWLCYRASQIKLSDLDFFPHILWLKLYFLKQLARR